MKVLVTGSKGFIGQNLIKRIPSDWFVTSFDIKDNLETRPKDLDLNEVDWVIHLGGLSSTRETDAKRVMDLNLAWSIELAEECEKHGVNLQWSSSASVYGNKYRCPMNEEMKVNPLNLYAMSKYFFEEYMKNKNPNIVWQGFRYFNVYGPHENHKNTQSSPYSQFAKQARDTGVIQIFEGSDECQRDFIHVDRVVNTHLRMLEKSNCGVFNIGTGSTRSFLDIARDIALLYDAKIEEIPFPEHFRSQYQEYTCADMYKLNTILGIH